MPNRRCITFAGAVGSSKTPIANYLSTILGLPVFNNDAIRTEVKEDIGHLDTATYDMRQEERCKALLATGTSFIYDASVDRKWSTLKEWLEAENYEWFIVSLDLSHYHLLKLYHAKKYTDAEKLVDYIKQHDAFLNSYASEVKLHITDQTFAERLTLAHDQVRAWLNN